MYVLFSYVKGMYNNNINIQKRRQIFYKYFESYNIAISLTRKLN